VHCVLVAWFWLGLVQEPVHSPVFQIPDEVLQLTVLVCAPHPLAQAWLSAGLAASVQVPQLPVSQFPVVLLQVTLLVFFPQAPQLSLSAGFAPVQLLAHFEVSQFPQLPPEQLALHVLVAVPPM
jgi:hypothetical protein